MPFATLTRRSFPFRLAFPGGRVRHGIDRSVASQSAVLLAPPSKKKKKLHIEPKDLWTVTLETAVKGGAHIALHLEKHVRKGRAKVRAVTGVEAGTARVVDVLAVGTVQFYRVVTRCIAQADRQQGATIAEMTRTGTKRNLSILFQLFAQLYQPLAVKNQERMVVPFS